MPYRLAIPPYKGTGEFLHAFSGFWVKKKWGEWWGSNPRITEPQSAVLAASPHPPHIESYDRRHMTLFIVSHPHGPVKKFFFGGAMAAALCALQFPVRHGTIAFHRGRKLLAYSFPSGMTPLRFITTGNFLQIVSPFPCIIISKPPGSGLWKI